MSLLGRLRQLFDLKPSKPAPPAKPTKAAEGYTCVPTAYDPERKVKVARLSLEELVADLRPRGERPAEVIVFETGPGPRARVYALRIDDDPPARLMIVNASFADTTATLTKAAVGVTGLATCPWCEHLASKPPSEDPPGGDEYPPGAVLAYMSAVAIIIRTPPIPRVGFVTERGVGHRQVVG